jgi:peptidoglycan hydrolase CwlO-like protein
MAHAAKYARAATGHLTRHFERGKDLEGNTIKYKNQDIDPSKSNQNYNLGPSRDISQVDFINQRCREVYCSPRKDVNVMCDWVVTKPADVQPAEQRQFFQETYDFMAQRYGQENVVSAYVHMDETAPHMHFAFVPVVYDERKDRHKVCAREAIDLKELRMFHQELNKRMEGVFMRDIGILNEATRDGNKSIEDLKRAEAVKEVARLTQEEQKLKQEVSKLTENKKALTGQIKDIENEAKALRKEVASIKSAIKAKEDIPRGKPSVMGDKVVYTKQENQVIQKLAQDGIVKDKSLKAIMETLQTYTKSALNKENHGLRNNIAALEKKVSGKDLEITGLKAKLSVAERKLANIEMAKDLVPDLGKSLASGLEAVANLAEKAFDRATGPSR